MIFLGQSAGAPGLPHISRDIFMYTFLSYEERTLHYLTRDLLEFTKPQVSASQIWLLLWTSVIAHFTDSAKPRVDKLPNKGHTALSNKIIVKVSLNSESTQ